MPFFSLNKANSITEEQLAYHLRKKTFSGVVAQTTTTEFFKEKYVCDEEVSYANAVFLNSNGRLEKADISNKAADFLALETGQIGSLIAVSRSGVISVNFSFPENSIIFLGTNGSLTDTPNINSSNIILQKIGKYANGLLIFNIESPYFL